MHVSTNVLPARVSLSYFLFLFTRLQDQVTSLHEHLTCELKAAQEEVSTLSQIKTEKSNLQAQFETLKAASSLLETQLKESQENLLKTDAKLKESEHALCEGRARVTSLQELLEKTQTDLLETKNKLQAVLATSVGVCNTFL